MPYGVEHVDDCYYVVKQNEDGSAGERVNDHCHDSAESAGAQIGAMEHSEEKAKENMPLDRILSEQNYAYFEVASGLIRAGRFEDAYAVIQKTPLVWDKLYLLQTLAEECAYTNKAKAEECLSEALSLISQLGTPEEKASALSNLAVTSVRAGFLDFALAIADTLPEKAKEKIVDMIKAYTEDDEEEDEDEEYNKSFVQFKQDDKGQYWFIGLYSNKFKDRQEEILSEKAHQEYVEWTKATGIKPPVTLYHQPKMEEGFWTKVMVAYEKGMISTPAMNALLKDLYKEYAIGETETVFFSNGFVGVVAKVYDDRVQWVKNMIEMKKDWGMSHGFVSFKMDANICERYRSFEFTVLLRSRAANVETFSLFMEKQMDKKDKEILDQIQKGTAEQIEQATEERREVLESAGTEFKENPEETPVVEDEKQTVEVEKTVELSAELLKQIVDSLQLEVLVKTIKERFDAIEATIDAKVAAVEGRVKAVEVDEDTKIANLYAPNFAQLFAQLGPANSEGTKVSDDKQKEIESQKGTDVSWLQGLYGGLQS